MSQQQWGQPQTWARGQAGPPSSGPPRWGQPGWGQPQWAPPGQGRQLQQSGPYGGPGPGRGFPPPPRRRGRGLWGLLLGLSAVILVAVAAFAVTGVTSPTSDAAYQNDAYDVPPPEANPPQIPVPQTYGQAEEWVVQNAFYDQTTPAPVRCDAAPINVANASDGQLDAHFEELMECLVRVWQPPVTQAGWDIYRPTVTIYGSRITTRCGEAEVNAFYCGADQQVYFSNQLPRFIEIVRTDRWAADVVMAHEFAHALQGRTGILIGSRALAQQAGDEATELELSRRTETQADCLSGMSLRSVSVSLQIQQADVAGILATYNAVGDDVITGEANVVGNHGLGRTREYWGAAGLGTGDVGACNTFTAAEDLVR